MPCCKGSQTLPPLLETFLQEANLWFAMARSVPAPSTRVARPRGRGAASQEKAEGQTARDQGTSKAAVEGPTERGDEPEIQDEEEDNDEESQSGDKSSSSSED